MKITFVGGFNFDKHITDRQADLLNEMIRRSEENSGDCPWSIRKDVRYQLVCRSCSREFWEDWLKFIVYKLLPFYILNGVVHWRGEDYTHSGKVEIVNNQTKFYVGQYVFNN